MIDIVYRYVPGFERERPAPASPQEALTRLESGNAAFADALSGDVRAPLVTTFGLRELGVSDGAPDAPEQAPFAVVLGCSDARVPTELVFMQALNDLFVVRVAGNVLGSECLGSIDYALAHLRKSLRLLVVMGHSGCGAVAASVDSFLTPANYLELATSHSLRSVVDRISIGVRAASRALEVAYGADVVGRPGYRDALLDTAVVAHAALTAHTLEMEFEGRTDCRVVFGVYDLVTRRVGLQGGSSGGAGTQLVPPPRDRAGFADLLTRTVSGVRWPAQPSANSKEVV